MSENIQALVVNALADASDKEIHPEQIELDMHLRDDLELDSLGALTLIMDMEDQLSISISEEEIMNFTTVRDVVSAIAERLPQEQKVG